MAAPSGLGFSQKLPPISTKPLLKSTSRSLWWLISIPVVTFGLGTWQVYRLQWKQDLIKHIQATLDQDPVDYEPNEHSSADKGNAAAVFANRRVRVIGQFNHDNELYVGPRTRDGVYGFEVITPFVLQNGTSVLVNRGFVPKEKLDPNSRPETQATGTTTIVGLRRVFNGKPSMFVPDNQPERNQWFYIDSNQMAAATGTQPVVIDALKDKEKDRKNYNNTILAREPSIELSNNHLQYAITWYSLSVATAVMIYLRRRM